MITFIRKKTYSHHGQTDKGTNDLSDNTRLQPPQNSKALILYYANKSQASTKD